MTETPRKTVKNVRLNAKDYEVPYRTPVGEVIRDHTATGAYAVLAAIVQQRCVDLSFPICAPTTIVPVDYTMREGVLVYRHTASLILLEAVRRIFPGARVTIGQAMGNGYFYEVRHGREFTPADRTRLDETMRQIVKADLPIRTEMVSLNEARQIFQDNGFKDKLRLLQTWWEPFVPIVYCGDVPELHHSPVAPSTGYIKHFELVYQEPGLVLRFPPRGKPQPMRPYQDTPKLFQVYRETRRWNEILQIEDVGQLNEMTIRGGSVELTRIAEGMHEKKIAQIADQISGMANRVRLVTIAGPSASGKTTFSKRLSLQLLVDGITPVALSTDNFYVNRADTPLDERGNYDFESIEAIDLGLFNDTLEKLLKGEEVLTPRYDFQTGMRRPKDKWLPMRLEPGQMLVVEGIHGLNNRLTEAVGDDQKFKIYVSALTQLCIDDHNRIFTSDARFLRRIVRDRLFRGYAAATTIETWPRVRKGEMRNIFPYQEQCDVMFNSSLVYEQAVLRTYAERFLLEVPQDHPSFVDAYRLLKFVEYFVPMFDDSVPQISILREFIGGSGFKYK
ncbi:MAG: nucleoside kinase [Deltaproteobacteria bacterium]|nr:nucleoside kinase [Deltaproteobacteria bacterium]